MVSSEAAMQTVSLFTMQPSDRRHLPNLPAGSKPATFAAILLLALATSGAMAVDAEARRELLEKETKARLKAAERIYLETVALTTEGTTDASGIAKVVTARLTAAGYTVVSDPAQPHDITVKVKCEEQKVWEGPARSGGEADLRGAAARLWRGPACQVTYRMDRLVPDWRHEVRGEAGTAEASSAYASTQGDSKALALLAERLATDPFPLYLAGAWGQTARLLHALDDPATTQAQQLVVIDLLGDMFAVEAIPALSRRLKDRDPALVLHAATALGAIGTRDCIPLLMELLPHQAPELRLAAVKGLGRLAPLHPGSDIVPALLKRLPLEPVPMQTEIVRALGRTPDRRVLEPLRTLNRAVQKRARSDSSPELKELKHALGQAIDPYSGTHTDE